MAVMTKQKESATQATGKTPIVQAVKSTTTPKVKTPIINLDDRMQKSEQSKGLAHQRTRLFDTLAEFFLLWFSKEHQSSLCLIKDKVNLNLEYLYCV